MQRLAFVFGLLGALLIGAPARAHDYTLGDLAIGHPWARVSAATNGAAYMTITTRGGADRLVAVSAPIAARAELHTHVMDGNVMRMRQVPAIAVQPGAPAALAPGGLHVMLFGLKEPLVEGLEFPLTLTFEKAGSITVEVGVQKGPAEGGHGMPPEGGASPGPMRQN